MCEIGFLCLHVEYGQLLVDSLENISNFLIEGPGKKRKKKKEKFPRLAKAFLLRVAESNRNGRGNSWCLPYRRSARDCADSAASHLEMAAVAMLQCMVQGPLPRTPSNYSLIILWLWCKSSSCR